MNKLSEMVSLVVIPESIIIQPDGELPRGFYYYMIISANGSGSGHVLQVYAPYKNNSIVFEWKCAEGGSEYRIYRGTIFGRYDGFFTVDSVANVCYFCDNGLGILNENINEF